MGYTLAAWGSFGGALAAIAGALTGLLFVALSVKGTALSESPALSSRAAQTVVLFMTSVLIADPRQGRGENTSNQVDVSQAEMPRRILQRLPAQNF